MPIASRFIFLAQAYYVDSYKFVDDFGDLSGIASSQTNGFANMGGHFEATNQSAVLTSNCFSLPQVSGSTFDGWSYLEFELSNTSDVVTNSIDVVDCGGTSQLISPLSDLNDGIHSVDISSVTSSEIQLVYTVEHSGTIPGTTEPSRINEWSAYGRSDGITKLSIEPDNLSVSSGDTVTFSLQVLSSGGTASNPVLSINMADLNGDGSTSGTAQDATVCYDLDSSGTAGDTAGECDYHRPLKFLSAGNGPNGEVPTTPGHGSTTGEIIWNLDDIPDGTVVTVPVTFKVPKGYVDGKQIALATSLNHGEVSTDGLYDNIMNVSADSSSNPVTVSATSNGSMRRYSPFSNLGPGAENIYDLFYFSGVNDDNPSDAEDFTMRITNTGSCDIFFKRVDISSLSTIAEYAILDSPAVGEVVGGGNDVVIKIFRTDYDYQSFRAYLRYDVDPACTDGSKIVITAETQGSITDTDSATHNVTVNYCRAASDHYIHRIQSGNEVQGNYSKFPGHGEYYIGGTGSIGIDDYFTTWGYYGNAGLRTHTVTLDKSYYVVNLTEHTQFMGLRSAETGGADFSIYKDIDGSAPLPDDPSFDTTFNQYDAGLPDSPHSNWYPVNPSWIGPFTDPPDASNPDAIIPYNPGARLLLVKYDDDPAWTGNKGNFTPTLLWKGCDDSYCTAATEGEIVKQNTGLLYTQYNDGSGDIINHCQTYNGRDMYYESKSWPKIYATTGQSAYPAGDSIEVLMHPHNHNHASEYIDSVWGINLFNLRDEIDFDFISGEIRAENSQIPHDNQNVQGQSCDLAAATLVVPDQTACQAATDALDPDCFVYWDIPDACQVPNGWGHNIPGVRSQDSYVEAYDIVINLPIKNTVLAETNLSIPAEIRHSDDLWTRGSSNAVNTSRWNETNYTQSTNVTVLETPGVDVTKIGPLQTDINDIGTYIITAENLGNAPNKGIYIIDELPKAGVNGSAFTPDYLKVYSDLVTTDILFSTSTDSNCFTDPLAASWTDLTDGTSTKPGYLSEASISDQSTRCIMARIEDTSTYAIQPGDLMTLAIDFEVPSSSTYGETIYNKAKVGARQVFGATTDIAEVETILWPTEVGNDVILGLDKEYHIDHTQPGRLRWDIKFYNLSSKDATNIELTDTLASELIFKSVENLETANEVCATNPCEPRDTNADGSGGVLEFTINALTSADGSPGGSDEGMISIWINIKNGVSPGSTIENCARILPTQQGTGANACSSFETSANIPVKTVIGNPDEGGSPPFVHKEPWGSGTYTITIENTNPNGVFFNIYDVLPDEVTFVPDSITVNGASMSNAAMNNGTLDFQSNLATSPGDSLVLSFDFLVDNSHNSGHLFQNSATVSYCSDAFVNGTCSPALDSNSAEAVVFNEIPIAQDDSYSGDEDNPIIMDPLSNDSDPDDSLDFQSFTNTQPTNGTLDYDPSTGQVSYTAQADYEGTDSFTYTICDSGQPTQCDDAAVTVDIAPINDPPVAVYDFENLDEDTSITFQVHTNDYDIDSTLDLNSIKSITQPSYGELQFDSTTNEFTYTPNANYYGIDGFEYEICDVQGQCDSSAVTLEINNVNDPPIAADDEYRAEDAIVLDVTDNDTDPDNSVDSLTIEFDDTGLIGQVYFDEERDQIIYIPDTTISEGYTTSFSYTLCDASSCDDATVTINYYPSLATTGRSIKWVIAGGFTLLIIILALSAHKRKLKHKRLKR